MKHSHKVLLGLALTSVLAVATAATLTATWVNPTTNTDNSALLSSEIKSTRIEYGTCSAPNVFGTKAGDVVVNGALTTGTVPNLPPGTWCARAYTTNIYNVESAASNVASKVVAAPTPNAPTNFSFN